jgi:hypothetical protein
MAGFSAHQPRHVTRKVNFTLVRNLAGKYAARKDLPTAVPFNRQVLGQFWKVERQWQEVVSERAVNHSESDFYSFSWTEFSALPRW